ncbi:hypothetical protein EMCRGX_G023588 [Ephydatia muelleri]
MSRSEPTNDNGIEEILKRIGPGKGYDDDPGSKRDAERARYEKDPETKGQNTTQTLNRSKTLKEHGTRKTLNPSGLVSVNAFMLKQESS